MDKKQDILEDDKSLEKEFPLLHSIAKENPFSVPEGYFDGLSSQIIEKCRREQVAKSRWSVAIEDIKLYLLGYKWRVLTIAGCMAVLCVLAIRSNNRAVSYEAMAQSIPDSLIVQSLDKNISDISISSLEDQWPETNASTMKSPADSTNQDIIAYLIDHNVNVSDIENEP